MGPSSDLIFFSGNIEATTLMIMNIFLVLLIVFYIYGLKVFKKYKFIVFLLVISPPLNFVTFLGNVDLTSESSEVTNILIDLTKRETLNQSSHLVNFLIKDIKNETGTICSNPWIKK